MSQSNYYRLFFAIVGYSIKEYIRLRRISLGALDIRNGNTCIIDDNIEVSDENVKAKMLEGFNEDVNHIGGVDLYMPIIEKGNK